MKSEAPAHSRPRPHARHLARPWNGPHAARVPSASQTWRTIAATLATLSLALSPLFSLSLHAQAPTGSITIVESTVSHSFAQQATFTVHARSEAEITGVFLFFRVTGHEQTESVSVEVEPAREINAVYTHDLRLSPLPPFATVDFWWQIESGSGERLVTEPQQFTYADDRFRWERLNAAGVTVHWIEGQGDPVFGQKALDVAAASVEEINAELRAPVRESIDIYIYDSQNNLETAMSLAGQPWVTGQAHPELGVIVVAVPPEAGYASRMKRYIPHEITHLLVYELVTPAGYPHVPEWLDEGLATANEQLPTPERAVALEEAREEGQLLPLEALCTPFSPDSKTAFLSYAQSGSLVRFIRERYGATAIRSLLAAYADGASCRGGVQVALDTSMSRLEVEWRASLEPQTPWRVWVERIGVWAGVWLISLLVCVPMVGRLRRR